MAEIPSRLIFFEKIRSACSTSTTSTRPSSEPIAGSVEVAPDVRMGVVLIPQVITQETYSSTPANSNLAIPDNDPQGTDPPSTIDVGDHVISQLNVNLDITHQRTADLEVYVVPDGGQLVQLFNLSGDNVIDDFNGTRSLGTWTLKVSDTRNKKMGTLNSWSITVVEY